MVFLNQGLEKIRDWFAGETVAQPTTIILGLSGTSALETDTALGTAVSSTESVFVSITKGTYYVEFEHFLSSSNGNGYDLRELGVNIGTALITRDTFPTVTKDSNIELQSIVKIIFDNE